MPTATVARATRARTRSTGQVLAATAPEAIGRSPEDEHAGSVAGVGRRLLGRDTRVRAIPPAGGAGPRVRDRRILRDVGTPEAEEAIVVPR